MPMSPPKEATSVRAQVGHPVKRAATGTGVAGVDPEEGPGGQESVVGS